MNKKLRQKLKNIKALGSNLYDRVWIKYREPMTVGYYFSDDRWAQNVTQELTESEKQQIDEYFVQHYGKKIPYKFHEVFKNSSGRFDVRCFPENLFAPHLAHYINPPEFVEAISDKNFLPHLAKGVGVKTPHTFVSSVRDIFFDENNNIISKDKAVELLAGKTDILFKPTYDTGGGANIHIFAQEEYPQGLSIEKIQEQFKYYKTDFAVQKLIKNHESVAKIYPHSLNTFRIVTYVIDGVIKNTQAIMRMGCGGARIDNTSAGGMCVGVLQDGTLLSVAMDDYTGNKAIAHPNTGVVFEGYVIEKFPMLVQAAKKMHSAVPQLGIVDWDFALDEAGDAVLVEANCRNGGGIQLIQYCHGTAFFGDDTEAILARLRELDNMSQAERKQKRVHL